MKLTQMPCCCGLLNVDPLGGLSCVFNNDEGSDFHPYSVWFIVLNKTGTCLMHMKHIFGAPFSRSLAKYPCNLFYMVSRAFFRSCGVLSTGSYGSRRLCQRGQTRIRQSPKWRWFNSRMRSHILEAFD